jgi:hypothetical protein
MLIRAGYRGRPLLLLPLDAMLTHLRLLIYLPTKRRP